MTAIRATATTHGKLAQFAPRRRRDLDAGQRRQDQRPRGVGHLLRHAAPVLQHALREQSAVGRADHDPESGGRLGRSVSRLPGGNPFPALNTDWADGAVPGVRRLRQHADRHASRQRSISGTSACSGRSATGCCRRSYLGNHTSHLWRATELNPAVFVAGATTGNINQRRRADPAEPGRRAVLRHDRPGRRHRPRQLQRPAAVGAAPAEERPERALELDAVEVHVRSGDDRDHRADDRRSRTIRTSTTRTAPPIAATSSTCRWWRGRRSSRTARCNAVFGDWQVSPLVRWQSGNRSSMTTGVDNALTGHGRPARRADPRRSVRRRHGRTTT